MLVNFLSFTLSTEAIGGFDIFMFKLYSLRCLLLFFIEFVYSCYCFYLFIFFFFSFSIVCCVLCVVWWWYYYTFGAILKNKTTTFMWTSSELNDKCQSKFQFIHHSCGLTPSFNKRILKWYRFKCFHVIIIIALSDFVFQFHWEIYLRIFFSYFYYKMDGKAIHKNALQKL